MEQLSPNTILYFLSTVPQVIAALIAFAAIFMFFLYEFIDKQVFSFTIFSIRTLEDALKRHDNILNKEPIQKLIDHIKRMIDIKDKKNIGHLLKDTLTKINISEGEKKIVEASIKAYDSMNRFQSKMMIRFKNFAISGAIVIITSLIELLFSDSLKNSCTLSYILLFIILILAIINILMSLNLVSITVQYVIEMSSMRPGNDKLSSNESDKNIKGGISVDNTHPGK